MKPLINGALKLTIQVEICLELNTEEIADILLLFHLVRCLARMFTENSNKQRHVLNRYIVSLECTPSSDILPSVISGRV